jgi:hypothetical protein
MYFFWRGPRQQRRGRQVFLWAETTAAEAGTACIFYWRGPRRRLNGTDDEISFYERADFHSAFSIAIATTTVNFRRDLL